MKILSPMCEQGERAGDQKLHYSARKDYNDHVIEYHALSYAKSLWVTTIRIALFNRIHRFCSLMAGAK